MPLGVFTDANFSLAGALSFVSGFALFGGVTFLPWFRQFVQGASATNGGLLLTPMMVSVMAVSLAGRAYITRTGRYRVLPIAGTALMAAGLGLFATMGTGTSGLTTSLCMVVLGAGVGGLMQTTTLIAQNSMPVRDMGAATGAAHVPAEHGRLARRLPARRGLRQPADGVSGVARCYGGGRRLRCVERPDDARHAQVASRRGRHVFQQAVTSGIGVVFLWAAVVAAAGFAIAWFIRHVPLRGAAAPAARETEPEAVPLPAAR